MDLPLIMEAIDTTYVVPFDGVRPIKNSNLDKIRGWCLFGFLLLKYSCLCSILLSSENISSAVNLIYDSLKKSISFATICII